MSDSLRSHQLYSSRLLCLLKSPGKNIGVGSIPYSSGSSWMRNWTQVSCIAGRHVTIWATREAHLWSVSSYFLFLPDSVLKECTFIRICTFLLGWPFIGMWLLVEVSHDPLYFCVVCCNLTFFVSNFIDLSPVPFFLWFISLSLSCFSIRNTSLIIQISSNFWKRLCACVGTSVMSNSLWLCSHQAPLSMRFSRQE